MLNMSKNGGQNEERGIVKYVDLIMLALDSFVLWVSLKQINFLIS